MRFQAITQIILVVLSLVMIFTIVRPMFAKIQVNQDEVHRFREAVATAGQFNARLSELRSIANSFSADDLAALELYVPAEIDTLSVSRDIVQIVEQNQMVVQSIGAEELEEPVESENAEMPMPPPVPMDPAMDPAMGMVEGTMLQEEAENSMIKQRFTLEVLGTYEQMKLMLADFERNAYPLRLVELEFTAGAESQLFLFTVVLETYALKFE